jgi:hypothetical protein
VLIIVNAIRLITPRFGGHYWEPARNAPSVDLTPVGRTPSTDADSQTVEIVLTKYIATTGIYTMEFDALEMAATVYFASAKHGDMQKLPRERRFRCSLGSSPRVASSV